MMLADMAELRRRSAAVAEILDGGLRGPDHLAERQRPAAHPWRPRRISIDDGDLRERGAFGNLPCGEGFIPPIETEGEGTLVVDGTIAGIPRTSRSSCGSRAAAGRGER